MNPRQKTERQPAANRWLNVFVALLVLDFLMIFLNSLTDNRLFYVLAAVLSGPILISGVVVFALYRRARISDPMATLDPNKTSFVWTRGANALFVVGIVMVLLGWLSGVFAFKLVATLCIIAFVVINRLVARYRRA